MTKNGGSGILLLGLGYSNPLKEDNTVSAPACKALFFEWNHPLATARSLVFRILENPLDCVEFSRLGRTVGLKLTSPDAQRRPPESLECLVCRYQPLFWF
jgi:hypothetical protein